MLLLPFASASLLARSQTLTQWATAEFAIAGLGSLSAAESGAFLDMMVSPSAAGIFRPSSLCGEEM
jgi:hypothetical protein